MLKKVLWIEDGAETELYNMLAPIYISGEYELSIAKDVTEAEEQLRDQEFDAVIVDIRLPPGRDEKWIGVYQGYRENRDAARLGLHLLRALFPKKREEEKDGDKDKRVAVDLGREILASRFAVFSVETDLESELKALGIDTYEKKNANTPRTQVLQLIQSLCG